MSAKSTSKRTVMPSPSLRDISIRLLIILGLLYVHLTPASAFLSSPTFNTIFSSPQIKHGHDHDSQMQLLMGARSRTRTETNFGDEKDQSEHGKQELLPGKIVAQRCIYRFSPTQTAIRTPTPYCIEERHYYSVSKDGSLKSVGDKLYIFRAGENMDYDFFIDGVVGEGERHDLYTKIGPALYTVSGLRGESEGEGVQIKSGEEINSSLVMALFCMRHPEIINGKGIELGSGVGVGGILSVIGAGIASEAKQYKKEPPTAPSPDTLSEIIFTDSKKQLLNECIKNLDTALFPESKVTLGLLDWTKNVQHDMEQQFNFILACDCDHDALSLANIIGNCLVDSSRDKFLHIQPKYTGESVDELKPELKRVYNMETTVRDITLERIDLVPLIMDSLEEADEQIEKESNPLFVSVEQYIRKVVSEYSTIEGNVEKEIYPEGKMSDDVSEELDVKHEFINASRPDMKETIRKQTERIRSIYKEWCEVYGKEVDESRFQTFLTNFLMMKAYAKESGELLELNEWFDDTCTQEECMERTSEMASCFFEGVEEEINAEILNGESLDRQQAWYKCTQEEYVALNSGRAELKVVDKNIETVMDADFIDLNDLFVERDQRRKAYQKSSARQVDPNLPYPSREQQKRAYQKSRSRQVDPNCPYPTSRYWG